MEGATGYLIAGYLLTWAVLGVYAWRISKREREARAALARGGEAAASPEPGEGIRAG